MQIIDTHAHLYQKELTTDLDSILSESFNQGLAAIIAPATDRASSESVVEICKGRSNVYCAVGIHPTEAHRATTDDWLAVEKLLDSPDNNRRIVAVGESGLDLYWKDCPLDVQKEALIRHLDWARKYQLPIILHCRDAQAELQEVLDDYFHSVAPVNNTPDSGLPDSGLPDSGLPVTGVVHSFTGDTHDLEKYLSWGFYISFAGQITYPQKKFNTLREAAKSAPADKILVETDSPYLVPCPLRGTVPFNYPAYVIKTAECLAQIRQTDLEDIARTTTQNALNLFHGMHIE